MKRVAVFLLAACVLFGSVGMADARGGRGGGGYHGGSYSSGSYSGGSSATAGEMTYSGNVKSFKYHNSSCKHFNCRTCTRKFSSAEEAKKAGFIPCGWCGG